MHVFAQLLGLERLQLAVPTINPYLMQHSIMLKGLPRGFDYADFEHSLTVAEVKHLALKWHIPRAVIERRDDKTGPLAVAFISLATAQHAEYVWRTLWQKLVYDREDNCLRPVKTSFALPKIAEAPTPEVSPEPLPPDLG